MALIFPRDLPETGVSEQMFEPMRVDYAAPEASGYQGGIQAGFPLWTATWTLGRMGQRRSDIWRAWLASMRGRQRRFYGRDLARPRPLAHIEGLPGGWHGNASSWSHALGGYETSLLGMTGLPAGLALSIGDYVGFRWTTAGTQRRALVRAVEDATANASGAITVTVEPPVPACVPAGAQAYLERPVCIMQLVTEETELAAITRRLAIGGGKITAIQELRE
jgi:hypothetical protein